MLIKQASEIDYSESNTVEFEGTVVDIVSEGDGEKKPFRFVVKLEESGETLTIQSWEHPKLQNIKDMLVSDEIFKFEAQANTFGNFGEQLRLKGYSNTGVKSTKKILRNININEIKKEIASLINIYCNKEPLKTYLKTLILNNDDFFKWPAATRMHHNFPGGLAFHSLNVAKVALNSALVYSDGKISLDVLVAGALLHDIGKLDEYKEDGSRTAVGNLIGHHVIGAEKVSNLAKTLGIDYLADIKTCMLVHIILSHHEKLEFGSPVVPQTMEAMLVAKADALDAAEEAVVKSLGESTVGSFANAPGTPCGRIFNWGV